MKVKVLSEQMEMFEMSVLEQSVTLAPDEFENLVKDVGHDPFVVIGRYFNRENKEKARKLAEQVFRTGRAMLITPPFGDLNIGTYLETPVSMLISRRSPETICRIVEPEWRVPLGEEIKIRSDHIIETALAAGVSCSDQEGKTTLIRYQPKNTSGVAFISTLQLLSYTALSEESDRQALLSAILSWQKENQVPEIWSDEAPGKLESPSKEDLITTILALVVAGVPDPKRLQQAAAEYLDILLPEDRFQNTIQYLYIEGILTSSYEGDGVSILSKKNLDQAVESLGIHAYVRELRELVRSRQEGSL